MRAIDCWVSEHRRARPGGAVLRRVNADYFKRRRRLLPRLWDRRARETMDRIGVEKAILTTAAAR
jgi:hypothetical protein